MSARVTAVEDPGMPGGGAESREYWPQQESESSWWSSTNWFRVPDSADRVNVHLPTAPSVKPSEHQPQNVGSIEVGGAVSFSRFTQAVGKPAKKQRKRLCLEAFRGHSPGVIKQLNELVAVPLLHPGLFRAIGIAPPHGLIASGSSGSGKSILVRKMVEELRVHFTPVDCSTLISDPSKVVDREGTPITKLFANAILHQPALILLDDVENIARQRETGETEYLTKLRASLRTELDNLSARGHTVLVIGATNTPEILCPSLLRSGRFDQHIMLSKPDTERRLELLLDATKDMKLTPLAKTYLRTVAEKTAGFVACDISALCVEAGLQCVREELYRGMAVPTMDFPQEFTPEELKALVICRRHFKAALKVTRPSGMRSEVEIPNVKWSDVGGQITAKEKLQESVEYPLKHATIVQYFGLSPSSSLLLYGPPGCGKTLMAKAVASQCEASFISVKGPEMLSSYLGESEKNLRALFQKAKQNAPCVLFFDEIDSIGRARAGEAMSDRFVAQLLSLMDEKPASRKRHATDSKRLESQSSISSGGNGTSSSSNGTSSSSNGSSSSSSGGGSSSSSGSSEASEHKGSGSTLRSAEEEVNKDLVFIMAATNRPGLLDPALIRRFDQLLYVGLPKLASRLAILQAALKSTPLEPAVNSEFLQSLATRTRGFSGSDLTQICNRARWLAIQAHLGTSPEMKTDEPPSLPNATVTCAQFEAALQATPPSVSPADLAQYKMFKTGSSPEPEDPEKAKMQQRIIQTLFKEALGKK